MPRRDPFTAMCRHAAGLASPRWADLHTHTTASDGDLTPSQLVAFARQAKVLALAVTDHDTRAGLAEAAVAAEPGLELVFGVELSASFRGREVHLIGYHIDPGNAPLHATLTRIGLRRRERFRDYISRLERRIPDHLVAGVEATSASPGRRHVARLLMKAGHARTQADAFRRFLDPVRGQVTPKELIPAPEAIALIRGAGGMVSIAHPPSHCDRDYLAELKAEGMAAVEAVYPSASNRQTDFLRETARTLGLVVTGGTDSHGTDCPGRRVGDAGIGPDEWAVFRSAIGHA